MRAIYFPLEQSNVMQSELDILKGEYESQRLFYQKQIDALNEDKLVRETEMKLRMENLYSKI